MATETANPSLADHGLITPVTLLRFNGIGADAEQIRHRFGGSAIGIGRLSQFDERASLVVRRAELPVRIGPRSRRFSITFTIGATAMLGGGSIVFWLSGRRQHDSVFGFCAVFATLGAFFRTATV